MTTLVAVRDVADELGDREPARTAQPMIA